MKTTSNTDESNTLLGDLLRFAGVSIAGKIVPAASVFIFSRMMSVEDFGVLSLFISYIWIFSTLLSLNIYAGVGRIIYDSNTDPKEVIGTSLIMIGGVYGIVWLTLLAGLGYAADSLKLPTAALALLPLVAAGYISESLITQLLIFLKRSRLLLVMTGTKAIATIGVATAMIYILPDHKYFGVVIAECMITLGFLLSAGVTLKNEVDLRFVRDYASRLLRYSLPLIVYVICLTLLAQADRIMIDGFFGKVETGLYSLAYNFASLILLGVTAILNAFQPAFFSAMQAGNLAPVLASARTTMIMTLGAAIFLVLLGEPIAHCLFSDAYKNSFDIIPIVAIGCIGMASFQTWVRLLAYHNRTKLISLLALIAVIVNIALNYWALADFGYKAAAYTTLVAQYLMAALCLFALWWLEVLRCVQPIVDLAVSTFICCMALALTAGMWDPTLNLTIRLVLTLAALVILGGIAWLRLTRSA